MLKYLKSTYPLFLFLFLFISLLEDAHSANTSFLICKKNSTGAIKIRSDRCKRGETKLNNINLLKGADGSSGANGTNGIDGADGTLRVYGDGSAGALSVTSDTTLTSANNQYTDITISSGTTLTVPSGTVLRCTGTLTNNGTIFVEDYSIGAYVHDSTTGTGSTPPYAGGGAGIADAPAGQGAFGTAAVQGGTSGIGLTNNHARMIIRPGSVGGSGGGAGFSGFGGGRGGGTLRIIAQGAITNNGLIQANGGSGGVGSGGGGGGIIILASKTSVTNSSTGTISVTGGGGGTSTTDSGAGGGGGGGFVHMISTTAPVNQGTLTLTGGSAGSNATTVSATPRIGGGGGGSCAGSGGSGSSVSAGNVSSGNSAGTIGTSFLTTADPTSLM